MTHHSEPLTIRPARSADREAVAAFTTDTFPWGDYVSDAFSYWLADEAGALVVAADRDDRPIGLARVEMLGAEEGWLAAARVHPDHRRQGVGKALNDWGVAWAAARGALVVRLLVENWNEPARRQVEGLGYRPVAKTLHAARSISSEAPQPATNGARRVPGPERLDLAPSAEAEPAFMAWSSGDLAREAHGMLASAEWRWRRARSGDIAAAARRRALWQCPSGWVIAEIDGEELEVTWLACMPDDADRLVRAVVDLAYERRAAHVGIFCPDVPWLTTTLSDQAFELHPVMIFEKAIVR